MRLSKMSNTPLSRFAFALALPLVSCNQDPVHPRAHDAQHSNPSQQQPLASSIIRPPSPSAKPPATSPPSTLEDSLSRLRNSGRSEIAEIIERRVAQDRPKMKLTPDEGLNAARYVLMDIQSMPGCYALSKKMPKTSIEIMRAVNERNVSRTEAEAISAYLLRLHDSMRMKNPRPFDENTSHVIGREWHEIDYTGEGMSWQSQKKFYTRYGITDLKTVENVRKLFQVESKLPYFSRIYKPEGKLPGF